jgi:hypothetical protein
MPSQLTPYGTWWKERLWKAPWIGMPFALFILGHGPDAYRLAMLPMLCVAVVFFRAFDDYFCFAYDQEHSSRSGQSHGSRAPLLWSLAAGLLYLGSLPWLVSVDALTVNALLVFGSVGLYVALRKSKLITLVSLAKYPVLLWSVGDSSSESGWYVVIATSLLLLIREVLEEFCSLRSMKAEALLALLLITVKLLMRYP